MSEKNNESDRYSVATHEELAALLQLASLEWKLTLEQIDDSDERRRAYLRMVNAISGPTDTRFQPTIKHQLRFGLGLKKQDSDAIVPTYGLLVYQRLQSAAGAYQDWVDQLLLEKKVWFFKPFTNVLVDGLLSKVANLFQRLSADHQHRHYNIDKIFGISDRVGYSYLPSIPITLKDREEQPSEAALIDRFDALRQRHLNQWEEFRKQAASDGLLHAVLDSSSLIGESKYCVDASTKRFYFSFIKQGQTLNERQQHEAEELLGIASSE